MLERMVGWGSSVHWSDFEVDENHPPTEKSRKNNDLEQMI
jgi:hypothetical protein